MKNICNTGEEILKNLKKVFLNTVYIEKDKNIDIIFETNKEVEEDFPMENMFSPYFTTKKNGNGLGLALCKKIVEEHRGVINVQKNFYRGLSFILSLPLSQE
jgi:signal transduction histidine kinase